MFEEVAELFEARGIHRLDHLLKRGDLLLCAVRTPRLIARPSLCHGPTLPMLICPEAIPVLQKAPRDLERTTNRTGQRLIDSGLLGCSQMIRATQHEITA
jgi:hypothetical protein